MKIQSKAKDAFGLGQRVSSPPGKKVGGFIALGDSLAGDPGSVGGAPFRRAAEQTGH